ncbi:MAG: glutamate synthase, partial [Hyphomicrobiales bacterium]|nr:glutamate synthase [Hyphomicrobiales bacterium]
GRPLPVPGADAENCITGVEFLDAFNRGWVFSTAKKIVVVGGGDTSIDVASVARRLGHINATHQHDTHDASTFGYTAHDVAGALRREGAEITLTSLFPIEQMTAAEHEREDAKREGVDIQGAVMPLEVVKGEDGRARALRMCKCTMKGTVPQPIDGTEYEIECDMVISAIGQMADLSQGLE